MRSTTVAFDEIRQEIKVVNSREVQVATHYYYQGVCVVHGDFMNVLALGGTAQLNIHDMQGFVKCRAAEPAPVRHNGPFSYPVGDN